MRGAILTGIVALLSLTALFRPKWGLYGYVWFALLRPDILAWSAGDQPFSFAIAAATLAGSAWRYAFSVLTIFQSWINVTLIALTAVMGVSVLTAQSVNDATGPFGLYLRVILMALLIPLAIETLEDFRILMVITALSMGVLGIRFGFYGLLAGGARFDDGYGGFLADNNCLALAFVMAVPLCWYAYQSFAPKPLRILSLICVFGCCTAIVWTHSRGGALALAVTFLVMILRSKHRLISLVGLVILIAPAVWMVRDSYAERLGTLKEYEEEASAKSRMELAKAAFRIWLDYPVFGVGFGSANFQEVVAGYLEDEGHQVAHNTYLQVAADSGTLAITIYVCLLYGAILSLQRSVRRLKAAGREDLVVYPMALQAAITGFAVGSTFLSRVTFDFYYTLLTTAAAWLILERRILLEKPAEKADESARAIASEPFDARLHGWAD